MLFCATVSICACAKVIRIFANTDDKSAINNNNKKKSVHTAKSLLKKFKMFKIIIIIHLFTLHEISRLYCLYLKEINAFSCFSCFSVLIFLCAHAGLHTNTHEVSKLVKVTQNLYKTASNGTTWTQNSKFIQTPFFLIT